MDSLFVSEMSCNFGTEDDRKTSTKVVVFHIHHITLTNSVHRISIARRPYN